MKQASIFIEVWQKPDGSLHSTVDVKGNLPPEWMLFLVTQLLTSYKQALENTGAFKEIHHDFKQKIQGAG